MADMTAVETEILRTLVDLEQAVRSLPTANPKPNLGPLLARVDALTESLPSEADPNLSHYLKRKSYEKARLWLEGREAEKGACGGR
jgi:hypothetical protein